MKLKSFGCSFIFGTDLPDAYINAKKTNPSDYTWPAHLAKHLGYEYNSYAYPGSGNLQILEKILNQAADSNKDTVFVIGWSWVDRFDYYNPNPNTKDIWSTILPGQDTDLSKIYYKNLHSEYQDKFTSLTYIKLAIDTLNQKGIPFIMTYIDNLLFDQRWNTSSAVHDLQNYVQSYMTTFNGQTFLEWSRTQGYPESATWHPLTDAHKAAGDYIIKVFDRQNIIDR